MADPVRTTTGTSTTRTPASFGPSLASPDVDGLPPGTRLNDVFEIVRFIANGGMGAVYEGVNISSGERTAIKVLLPALMHDQRSWEMFRREAVVLTRVSHPAIVQYRILAQDTRVGVPYIATEFIDGVSLAEVLTGERPSLDESLQLLTRLAQGLARAHTLGAVHRDLSPDNVLLPAGQIHEAKIIDFGIAKDLDPSTATIIGGGFAGKLGYCAPEQLGDYGQSIGPWTDVYSLGLLIYSFSVGRAVDMGATLSQAVDRRRRGVDLEQLTPELRPLVMAMLQPDPAQRLRSMEDVLRLVEAVKAEAPTDQAPLRKAADPGASTKAVPTVYAPPEEAGASVAPGSTVFSPFAPGAASGDAAAPTPEASASPDTSAVPPPVQARKTEGVGSPARAKSGVKGVLILASIAAVGGVAALAVMIGSPRRAQRTPTAEPSHQPGMANLTRAIGGADCTLVHIQSLNEARAGSTIVLEGATSDPTYLSALLNGALRSANVAQLRMDDVVQTPAAMCGAMNAVRPAAARLIESPGALTSPQREYEIARQADGSLAAAAVITMNPELLGKAADVFLLGPDGGVTYEGRVLGSAFTPSSHFTSEALSDGKVRLTAPLTTPGLFGIVAVGHNAGDPPPGSSQAALRALTSQPQSRAAATWVSVVDNVPNADTPASPTPGKSPATIPRKSPRSHIEQPASQRAPSEKKDDLNGLY